MSDPIKDGGPAFPNYGPDKNVYDRTVVHGGMSLLDWLAGQAIIGLSQDHSITTDVAAREAYVIAREMLKARDEK